MEGGQRRWGERRTEEVVGKDEMDGNCTCMANTFTRAALKCISWAMERVSNAFGTWTLFACRLYQFLCIRAVAS